MTSLPAGMSSGLAAAQVWMHTDALAELADAFLSSTRLTLAIRISSDCDVVISRKTVSGTHTVLERKPNGWLLRHVSTTNPTMLNDAPLDFEAMLRHGDEFAISKRKFRFETSLPPVSAPSPVRQSPRHKQAAPMSAPPDRVAARFSPRKASATPNANRRIQRKFIIPISIFKRCDFCIWC